MSPFKKDSFCLLDTILNSSLRIFGEVFIPHNELMKLVSQVICACSSSMTIIHRKEWASWPLVDLLEFWLYDIQNYRNSVFIVISYNALMGIGSITANYTIFLTSKFCGVIRSYKSIYLLLFHLHVFFLLFSGHNEPPVSYKLILALWLPHRSLIFSTNLIWTGFFNFLMIWARWWLWMTILLLFTILRLLKWLLLLTLIWLVSHTWWCSKSVDASCLWGWFRCTACIVWWELRITVVFI